MPIDHSNCDHPSTREARDECREEMRRTGEIETAPRKYGGQPYQIRRRARRHQKNMEAELTKLYRKPVDEWDLEELAHGKPRDRKGNFSGVPPKWVTREVHEEAVRRFKTMLNSKVRILSVPAIEMLLKLMTDDRMVHDDEGEAVRHLVPPSVKAQIGTFLIEHVIGKPDQRVEAQGDMVHRIESVLASAMAGPQGQVLEIGAGAEDDEYEYDDDYTEEDDEGGDGLVLKR